MDDKLDCMERWLCSNVLVVCLSQQVLSRETCGFNAEYLVVPVYFRKEDGLGRVAGIPVWTFGMVKK